MTIDKKVFLLPNQMLKEKKQIKLYLNSQKIMNKNFSIKDKIIKNLQ